MNLLDIQGTRIFKVKRLVENWKLAPSRDRVKTFSEMETQKQELMGLGGVSKYRLYTGELFIDQLV